MTPEAHRKAGLDAAYLAACAVDGKTPDAARTAAMDLSALYRFAEQHMLAGAVAMGLESAGVQNEAFTQAKGKIVRKAAILNTERAAVQEALEEAGVWYVPLKGCVLQALYPKLGMRQMADVDILIDDGRCDDVRRIMERLGFSTESFGRTHHDIYHKASLCSFEMHRMLFAPGSELYGYYCDLTARYRTDGRCRFSDEDLYVYMIAHERKHYQAGGTGLRSLLDTYLYCRRKGETLDRAYIGGELEKLGLADFERANRKLSLRLFGGGTLTDADEAMLDYVLSSGAYGSAEHLAENRIAKKGRAGYLFSRIFLPRRDMQKLYPVLERRPILLPLCWVRRLLSAWKTKRKKMIYQFKAAFRK